MTDQLSYDSFHDPHLQKYFQNKNIRKHLRKIGLINRSNEIISYKEYQAAINQRSRQENIRALLSHGVVQRVIELEKSRQANIQNYFESIEKKIRVENIRESRQHHRQFNSNDIHVFNRPKTSFSNNNFNIYQQEIKLIDENKKSPSRVSFVHVSRSSPRTNISTKSKITKTLRLDINTNSKNHCQITMIYLGSPTHVDCDQIARQQNSSEIIVMQQHCGGENLILFKNNLKQNEKFTFESRRHSAYPFALSLYVNGLIDCRISVCCEYKHKIGLPLGGKRATFAILNVQGGKPCQTCRFNQYILNTSLLKQKTFDKSSILTEKSKVKPSYDFNPERLLSTPIPCDEHESETIKLNENDEYHQAVEIYESLLTKINISLNWKEESRYHWQLANICKEGLGDYQRSLNHYLNCLEILSQYISPLDIKLRNLYLSIGHIYLLQDKTKNSSAIDYFQRILNIDYSTSNKMSKIYLINDHYYLGLLYQNEENFSQALFHFKKSLKYILSLNSKENNNSNMNLNEFIFQNDYLINETIYDKKALESLSINSLANISEIHFNLAITYQNLRQKQNALKHAEKALQLSIDDQTKYAVYQNYLEKLQQI